MEWFYFLCMLLQGIFCYWVGLRVGKSETTFQPTQETWLELEKFRWTHASVWGDEQINECMTEEQA